MAWGLVVAVAAAVVPLPPAASTAGGAAVEEGPLRALSLAGAAPAVVAAALAETQGGRVRRRILRSWLSFSTTFTNPSTPVQTFLSPTSSSFARPLAATMPLSPTFWPMH